MHNVCVYIRNLLTLYIYFLNPESCDISWEKNSLFNIWFISALLEDHLPGPRASEPASETEWLHKPQHFGKKTSTTTIRNLLLKKDTIHIWMESSWEKKICPRGLVCAAPPGGQCLLMGGIPFSPQSSTFCSESLILFQYFVSIPGWEVVLVSQVIWRLMNDQIEHQELYW